MAHHVLCLWWWVQTVAPRHQHSCSDWVFGQHYKPFPATLVHLPGMVSQHRGLAQPVLHNFRRMHHAVCDVLMRVVGDLRGQFMTSTGRMGLGLGFRFLTSETTRSGITGVILAATLLW